MPSIFDQKLRDDPEFQRLHQEIADLTFKLIKRAEVITGKEIPADTFVREILEAAQLFDYLVKRQN